MVDVSRDEATNTFHIVAVEWLEIDHLCITTLSKVTGQVQYIRDAATHACCEITSGSAQDDNPSTGHVFAAMVADPFHDRVNTAVSYGEPLAGYATNKRFTPRAPIQGHVSDNDVVLGDEG